VLANYYDSCIKVGNDVFSQVLSKNNEKISFKYIPIAIKFSIQCLVGVDSLIELSKLNREISMLEDNIDLEELFFLYEDSVIKIDDKQHFLKEFDTLKIKHLFGFIPNIISKEEFIYKHDRTLVEGAGGYYGLDGSSFNRFNKFNLLNSTEAFKIVNPKQIGNIIGVVNLVELFNDFTRDNNDLLFNLFNDKSNDNNIYCNLLNHDLSISFDWLNLDKIKKAINMTGCSIIYFQGLSIIKTLDEIGLILNGETKILTKPYKIEIQIQTEINKYFRYNSNLSDICFLN
jgi:hypothetical protein